MKTNDSWGEYRDNMPASRQILVTVIGMFLMFGISTVVHCQEVDEAQVRICLTMLVIMLHQLDPLGRLVNAETGEQTASQHQTGQ